LEVAKLELEYRRPGGSPTDMLLTNWGHSNATVEMLVSHLLRAGLHFAAEKLRGLGLCPLIILYIAASLTLTVPTTRRTTLGERAFLVAAARAWNALPLSAKQANTLLTFRRRLKSALFDVSFAD